MKRIYCLCIVSTGLMYGSEKLKNPTIQVITGEFTAITVPALAVPSASAVPSQPLLRKEPKALTARASNEKSDKKTSAQAHPKRATCPPAFTAPKTVTHFKCIDHDWEAPTKCPLCGEADFIKQVPAKASTALSPAQTPSAASSVLATPVQAQEMDGEDVIDDDGIDLGIS